MNDDKSIIRKSLRKARRSVSPAERRLAAQCALRWMRRQIVFSKARRIGFYWPMSDEFDVLPLMAYAEKQGKACYLPVVPRKGRRLWFVRNNTRTRWKNNQFGIPEPVSTDRRRAEKLDLIFVPLMGVDAEGVRLGMGGGFYDTSLQCRFRRSYRSPRLIGVAFDVQRVPKLAADPWDIRMDALLTESGLVSFPVKY